MLDRIPKPVLFGVVGVLIALALVVIFKSAKSAGGSGDYDVNEIRRLAKERESQPNGGRTMPAAGSMRPGGSGGPGSAGMSGSSGGPGSSGGGR